MLYFLTSVISVSESLLLYFFLLLLLLLLLVVVVVVVVVEVVVVEVVVVVAVGVVVVIIYFFLRLSRENARKQFGAISKNITSLGENRADVFVFFFMFTTSPPPWGHPYVDKDEWPTKRKKESNFFLTTEIFRAQLQTTLSD